MSSALPPIPSIGRKGREKTMTYAIEECQACHEKTKRAFKRGDHVYKQAGGKCSACGSTNTMIKMIFSEPLKPT